MLLNLRQRIKIFIISLLVFTTVVPAFVLAVSDSDQDGLNDDLESKFNTDIDNPDSDGDGFKDGLEVDWGYDPLSSAKIKLPQRLAINLKDQKLFYLVKEIELKSFTISSGKPGMDTPKGKFKIINKDKKAWSKKYGLWMPFWLGLNKGEFGIHELPIWPNSYREGSDHLGKPVSHGCIRLGIGPAKYLFERIATGTEVQIY